VSTALHDDRAAQAAAERLYREAKTGIVERIGRHSLTSRSLDDLLAAAYVLGAMDAAEASARVRVADEPVIPAGL
jgi:hypothetical protein